MALATPSLRSAPAAARWKEPEHVAAAAPLGERADAPAATGREGTLREHVRMELLVARALETRSR
jgi:hypothetical protein